MVGHNYIEETRKFTFLGVGRIILIGGFQTSNVNGISAFLLHNLEEICRIKNTILMHLVTKYKIHVVHMSHFLGGGGKTTSLCHLVSASDAIRSLEEPPAMLKNKLPPDIQKLQCVMNHLALQGLLWAPMSPNIAQYRLVLPIIT